MANRIHCSERSADLLREQDPNAQIIPRGWINVKGKGEMKTFWIEKPNLPEETLVREKMVGQESLMDYQHKRIHKDASFDQPHLHAH